MSLFKSEKKKEEAKTCCSCSSNQAEEISCTCCGEEIKGICCIKVLGAGCKSCHELFENAKKAAAELGLGVEVEYITDMQKIMEYGVMSMPALVVNDKVVSMGKVLKPGEIEKLLTKME
ncbi:MAG: thioredoxin family protein [Ruminiclostridium sp.]